MDTNGTHLGKELAMAFLALFVFGLIYNLVVEHFQKRTKRFTAELVVGGVSVTLMVSGFIVGWENVVKMFILFAGSGLPMVVGSWIRSVRDDEAAKEIARDSLNGHPQDAQK